MIRTSQVAILVLANAPVLALASDDLNRAAAQTGYAHGRFMGQFLPYGVALVVAIGVWMGWRAWKSRRNRRRDDV